MNIIDGKHVRDLVLNELEKKIKNQNLQIGLDIIYIGNNQASDLYIKNKIKYAQQVGIKATLHQLDENVDENEVKSLIEKLNDDSKVHGIILQSPIPKHLNFNYLSGLITQAKDVDGFNMENVYANYINSERFLPCTVKGICYLLDYYKIDIAGKSVVIVGRSLIVGKPLALALLNRNATVTIAHSKTENLKDICKSADILIVAVGNARMIKRDFIKPEAVVIDVGINKSDGITCGDVDFDDIKDICSYITPVPGGVGPMTVAMLLDNTYRAYLEVQNG